MDLITENDLNFLLKCKDPVCISIFIPTRRSTAEVKQNRIRLKKMIEIVKERLAAMGIRPGHSDELLQPAHQLLVDDRFLERQSDGFALFLSDTVVKHFRVPLSFPELAVVTNHFHIAPLIPLFTWNYHFYVLALSENETRLLHCGPYTVEKIEAKAIPRRMSDAIAFKDTERVLQFHTKTPRKPGHSGAAIFHGHGGGNEDEKEVLEEYFRQINLGLHSFLRKQNVPLVLASVDYFVPIYKKMNTYSSLWNEWIPGNPELLTDEELQMRGWEIVRPKFDQNRIQAMAKYDQYAGTRLSSDNLEEVLYAARAGKVESLFVNTEDQRWGTYDPTSGMIVMHQSEEPGDVDLLNVAILETLKSKGEVYPVQIKERPEIFATLRY